MKAILNDYELGKKGPNGPAITFQGVPYAGTFRPWKIAVELYHSLPDELKEGLYWYSPYIAFVHPDGWMVDVDEATDAEMFEQIVRMSREQH